MDELNQSRLASALALLAGAWALLSPIWISITGGALTNLLIIGGAIAVLAAIQMFVKNTLPSWLMGILAVWMFASAFMFSISTAATWSMVLTAIATFVLANWDGMEVSRLSERHHVASM